MSVDANLATERYKIVDNSGNQLIFNSDGKLTIIKDNNGNTITLEYLNGRLVKATDDDASSETNLNYDANNRLQTIVEPNGRITAYEYEATTNRLKKITYPDGKITTYSYDTKGNLTTVQNHDGYKIVYTYNSVAPYRVKDFSEAHTSGASGEKTLITYGTNRTTFTDANYPTKKLTYIFNDNGNVLSVFDNEGNAQSLDYENPDAEGTTISNTVYTSIQPRKTILNYLLNHNAEATTYWTSNSSADSTGSATFSSEENNLGSKSLKISKTNTSGHHTFQQPITVDKAKKTYTYSAYVKTDVSNINGKGAQIYIAYQDNTGAWKKTESEFINGIKDWHRVEVRFTLPDNAVYTTIYPKITLTGESGTVYFDSLQLEDGNIANGYNLVENANLSDGTVVPTFWTKNSFTDGDDTLITDNILEAGNKVFKITGVADKQKNLSQAINISGVAGDKLVVGGWAKGASIPLDDKNAWHFAIDIGLEKVGGGIEWHGVEFNHDSNDWQYALSKIEAESAFTKVYYYVLYYNNANTAYFDRLELYKEGFGEKYDKNADNQLIKETDILGRTKEYTYNGEDLITSKDPRGNNTSYTYDGKHNITSTTTPENVLTTNTYDEVTGNITSTTIGSGSEYIKSTTTYTIDGKNISSTTDMSGNTVNYEYFDTGAKIDLLKTVRDPKNQATNYDYDDSLKLNSVSKTVDGQTVTNSYTYHNDLLSAIAHNGFSYNFNYDDFGKLTKVSVGTQDLVNNTYKPNSSLISNILYGNGQNISYSYDRVDRVSSINFGVENYQDEFKYEYDENGNVGYHEDNINYLKYRYIYDIANRLTTINSSNGDTTEFSYDANDNVGNFKEKIGNINYTTSYDYDKDDRNTNITTTKGKSISYAFDALGRQGTKTINTITPFVTNYTYKAGGPNSPTTILLDTINNQGNIISYTYDANGNISTITENGNVTEYFYDELNELIRENNQVLNKTIVYVYDIGGNILTKTEYPYTTSTPSNPTKTYAYTYDATWKDKLTNFDGKEISYDKIGNITSYDGYTYLWEQGRQLASISNADFNASYKYNDQGIRTEKTVNGVTTKYHLVNGNVTQETNGTDTIYYTYDNNGNLVSMILNGVEYYYVINAQDDIIGIIDDSGNLIVSYVYDGWGKIISISGELKDTVGVKNPYRYRGYRYDNETELYYLQSRYYTSEWGRFINADDTLTLKAQAGEILGSNMFAYSGNNAITYSDPSGYWLPNSVKNTLKALISEYARDWRENTILNIASTFGGAFLGALSGYRKVQAYNKSSLFIKKNPLMSILIKSFNGSIKGFLTGMGAGKIIDYISIASKYSDPEGWLDRQWYGQYIDNQISYIESKVKQLVDYM